MKNEKKEREWKGREGKGREVKGRKKRLFQGWDRFSLGEENKVVFIIQIASSFYGGVERPHKRLFY